MPSGLSSPFSASVISTLSPATPFSEASSPAGAFQTPRWPSVRAITPATAPLRRERVHLPVEQRVGLANAREVERRVARRVAGQAHAGQRRTARPPRSSHAGLGSTMSIARRFAQ